MRPATTPGSRTAPASRWSRSRPCPARDPAGPVRDLLAIAFRAELDRRQDDEIGRGLTLVGPHRDDLVLTLGPGEESRLPVKGYASHGESWSFALALRLASYDLLRADGDDPILILDDVFAELDTDRRDQLAGLVAGAEQVLVTAAVQADVPALLAGVTFLVAGGEVTRVEGRNRCRLRVPSRTPRTGWTTTTAPTASTSPAR